jgi:hypothetical protein
MAIKKSRVIYNRGQEYESGFEMSEWPVREGGGLGWGPLRSSRQAPVPRGLAQPQASARQRQAGCSRP